MKYQLLARIAFLLLILSSLYSQQEWRRLTTDDGLSSNKILTIYPAKNGDIWIGTEEGVDRYNGVFEEGSLYGAVNSVLESPSGQIFVREVGANNITTTSIYLFDGLEWDKPDFFVDNDIWVSEIPQFSVAIGDKLWISTRDGLVGFDGQKWQLYDPDARIDWLAQTSDGRLWSESWKKNGLVSFDGQKWNLEFNVEDSLLDKLGAITQVILVTSTGKILLGTNKGLYQYDPVLNSITDLNLGQVEVSRIYETAGQSLWIATNKGLHQLANGKWQLTLADQSVGFIQEIGNGELWVGTDQGLYRLEQGKWIQQMSAAANCLTELPDGTLLVGGNDGLKVKPPTEEALAVLTHLQGNFISRLFLSSDGLIWCYSTAGIFSYDGVTWKKHDLGSQNPDVRRWIWSSNIFEDSQGRVWFASLQNVLKVFSDGKLENNSMGSSSRSEIIETSDGRMWAAGYKEPVVYDGNDKKEWIELPGYGNPDLEAWSYAIHADNDESIWVGGAEGIWRFKNNQWKEYTDVKSLMVPTGYDFIRGPDGTFWVGTILGIYKLTAEDTWEEVKSGSIRQFHLTANGTLVAVDGSGGLLINKGQQWIEHASYSSGRVYHDWYGHGFVEYPTGVFWLATNKSLRRIQGDFWYDLTVADGLPSNDVQTVELDHAGNLWVGTREGITRFTPPKNLNPPAVQLIRIDGDKVPDNRTHSTGQAFVAIDWRGGDIETDPSRLQFQYSIDGQWSEPLKQSTVTIGLRNGEHQFSIRAIDHHFNTSTVDSITIIVKTEAPYLLIGNPDNGDTVSGELYIKGEIRDDDFEAFQVFISDAEQTDVPTLEDDAEANLQKPYQLIFEAWAKPRTQTLARLKTKPLDDGDYQIWLTAQDQLQHSSFAKIMVRVDNTPPSIKILEPKANQRVLRQITLSVVVSDLSLDSYRLDSSSGSEGKSWEQIYLQAGLFQKSEDVALPEPDLKTVNVNQEWVIPVKEGQVWIRLTATDIAGNTSSQTIQVEVPTAVVTRKGGIISPMCRVNSRVTTNSSSSCQTEAASSWSALTTPLMLRSILRSNRSEIFISLPLRKPK